MDILQTQFCHVFKTLFFIMLLYKNSIPAYFCKTLIKWILIIWLTGRLLVMSIDHYAQMFFYYYSVQKLLISNCKQIILPGSHISPSKSNIPTKGLPVCLIANTPTWKGNLCESNCVQSCNECIVLLYMQTSHLPFSQPTFFGSMQKRKGYICFRQAM